MIQEIFFPLGTKQAAYFLGKPERTVKWYCKKNNIHKVGNTYSIDEKSFEILKMSMKVV